MEKEELKDKIVNFLGFIKNDIKETIFSTNIWSFVLFTVAFYFILFFSKSLFLFLIINLIMLLSIYISRKIGGKTKINIIKYLYVLLPCYSLIYISNNKGALDIFLWLFLLTIFSKISNKVFNNILENVIFEKNKLNIFMGYFGSLLIGVFIGLVSALLLKQKISTFLIINIFAVVLILLQERIYNRINSYLELPDEENKFFKYLLYNYNNLVFTSVFVAILLLINVIK